MALLRVFDNVCLAFYIMSLLVAVAVDSQAVLPAAYYPDVFRGVLTWHIETNRDFLMGNPPTWFKSLCYCELLLQTPFYLLAIFAYTSRASWIRLPAVAYGVHVATTMVPIFAELLAAPPAGRWDLVAIYAPFAVVPLLIAVRMAADPQPFSARQAALLPAKRD